MMTPVGKIEKNSSARVDAKAVGATKDFSGDGNLFLTIRINAFSGPAVF
jgi:hypothetical protein